MRVRRLVLGAPGLVAAAVILAQAGALAASTDPVRITKPVQATKEDFNPDRTYSSPYLVVDPSNPMRIIGSFVDLRTKRCGIIRSLDGGQTWKKLDAMPALPSYPFCLNTNSNIFHAPMAWGRNGTLYIALAGWDLQDGSTVFGNISVLLGKSTNFGDSWTTTLVRDARGKQGDATENNRPIGGVAVDTKSGSQDIVYVTWQSRASNLRSGPSQEPDRPFVAVSTDGGAHFGDQFLLSTDGYKDPAVRTEALKTTTTQPGTPPTTPTTAPPAGTRAAQPDLAANYGGRNPDITIDGKGNVYVFWHSITSNITPSPAMGHFLSKSTDHGKTWTVTQIAPFDARNSLATQIIWSPKGGPDGTLHLVQQGTDRPEVASYGSIYYRRSTDGGKTWSERKMLPDTPVANLTGQFIPNIAIAPNGRIDVAWWDTRLDPGIRANDVYMTSSYDNGLTWTKNVRVTDRTVNRNYGVWGVNFDMSSPPGLAATDKFTVVAWDDTRLTDTAVGDSSALGGGTDDIYAANVQYSAVGGGASKGAQVGLAVVLGLVAVGVVLFGLAMASRRRDAANLSDRAASGTKSEPATTKSGAKVT